jgi:hypothetical protein
MNRTGTELLTRHAVVMMAMIALLASIVGAVVRASPAAAATSYKQITSADPDGPALAVQQGHVVLVPPDPTRFDRQWEIFDQRPDGTFMLRNRGVQGCLSRNANGAIPELAGTHIVGCAGTNDPQKRWSTSVESGSRKFIRNAGSQQRLGRLNLCFIPECGLEEPLLLTNSFIQPLIDQGAYSITGVSWRITTV